LELTHTKARVFQDAVHSLVSYPLLDLSGSADATATLILGIEEQRRRSSRGWAAKAWTLLSRVTVGHGYRPLRSLVWIAMFVVVGACVFSAAKACGWAMSTLAVAAFSGALKKRT
jgi:hypothetical protein